MAKSTKSINKSKSTKIRKASQRAIATAGTRVKSFVAKINSRRLEYLGRRPHRTLRRTKRRDYKRSLKLPGYIELTVKSLKMVWANRWQYLGLITIYALLTLALSAVMTQDSYSELQEAVNEARDGDTSVTSSLVAIMVLFWNVFYSQMTTALSTTNSTQQIAIVLVGLYAWLATIWTTRVVMAGRRPRVRDSLYNSGSPVIALMMLVIIAIIQALPAATAVVVYGAADASGMLDQTVILMLAGGAMAGLVTLSMYWITSTLLAMVIVTLPGMYPMEAMRLAGDLAVGRRIRILLRIIWIAIVLLLIWLVVLIPVILLDGAIKSTIPALDWLPLVPIVAIVLTPFSLVTLAVYIYVFYRKVVDDGSAPA